MGGGVGWGGVGWGGVGWGGTRSPLQAAALCFLPQLPLPSIPFVLQRPPAPCEPAPLHSLPAVSSAFIAIATQSTPPYTRAPAQERLDTHGVGSAAAPWDAGGPPSCSRLAALRHPWTPAPGSPPDATATSLCAGRVSPSFCQKRLKRSRRALRAGEGQGSEAGGGIEWGRRECAGGGSVRAHVPGPAFFFPAVPALRPRLQHTHPTHLITPSSALILSMRKNRALPP